MFNEWWHIAIAALWIIVGLLFGIWIVNARRRKFGRKHWSDWLLLPSAAIFGFGWIPLVIWAEITSLFEV